MDIKRVFNVGLRQAALAGALAVAVAVTTAFAQAPGRQAKRAADPDVFGAIAHWFTRQAEIIDSGFKNAGRGVENFGYEAGIAARTTVNNAKTAADAVASLPKTRVVTGHVRCHTAPNGAPDCVAAAHSLCQGVGFDSGKSLDMTTAEICPPKVYLAGRNGGPGCHTETFVSRVLCQ